MATKTTAKQSTTKAAEEFIADAQKTVSAQSEKFGAEFEKASSFGQETLEALKASGEIATKAATDLGEEITAFSQKSFDETVAAAKDMAAAKSPTEFFEKQNAFATAAFEGFVAQATKFNDVFAASAKEASAPVAARFTAATDMAKAYTA